MLLEVIEGLQHIGASLLDAVSPEFYATEGLRRGCQEGAGAVGRFF